MRTSGLSFQQIVRCGLLAATVSIGGMGACAGPQSIDVSSHLRGPGVRNAHALVFDVRRQVTLLFGGASASAVLSDLWSWNGRRWTREPISGPSPRTFPAMVWDAARDEAVLFGGRRVLFGNAGDRDTFLSDTWTLSRSGWHRHSAPGPAPRSEAGMAYDPTRRVAVLFGGYNDTGGTVTRLADTWEWDGRRWELKSETGPPARSGVPLAFDHGLQRVVLFGGGGGARADTWTWNGKSWERLETNTVTGRSQSILVYDSHRRLLLRTAGWDGKARVSDTWRLDAAAWSRLPGVSPDPRNHTAAVFDSRRRKVVLVGGHDGERVFGDVWEWDGGWKRVSHRPPEQRVNNGH